jgi:hypothetical protein
MGNLFKFAFENLRDGLALLGVKRYARRRAPPRILPLHRLASRRRSCWTPLTFLLECEKQVEVPCANSASAAFIAASAARIPSFKDGWVERKQSAESMRESRT